MKFFPPSSFVGCLQTFPDCEAIAPDVDKGSKGTTAAALRLGHAYFFG